MRGVLLAGVEVRDGSTGAVVLGVEPVAVGVGAGGGSVVVVDGDEEGVGGVVGSVDGGCLAFSEVCGQVLEDVLGWLQGACERGCLEEDEDEGMRGGTLDGEETNRRGVRATLPLLCSLQPPRPSYRHRL